MKLTAATVVKLTLPEGKSEAFFWDHDVPGFALRLRAGGSRVWVLQHRVGRRQRRITIGSAKAISPADARATAAKLYARIKLGEDPTALKARAVAAQGDTFAAALDLYLARQRQSLRPRSFAEVLRHLATHAKPLHNMPLVEIDRRHVAKVLAGLGETSGPTAANQVRTSLSAFFTWCAREGLADANPATHTNKFVTAGARERVLSDDELRAIWVASGDARQYGVIIKLLTLTACRREEIGALRWSEVDIDQAIISLPSARTKNAKPFDVPLSATALAVLEAHQRRDDDFVFGRRDGFRGWADAKTALDKRIKIAPWRVHDLRRTAATRMADIGVLPHVVEAVLNHQSGAKAGIAGVYNRAMYESEKRQALERWSEHLLALTEDRSAKVLAFAGRPQ
jgi:integrase